MKKIPTIYFYILNTAAFDT